MLNSHRRQGFSEQAKRDNGQSHTIGREREGACVCVREREREREGKREDVTVSSFVWGGGGECHN